MNNYLIFFGPPCSGKGIYTQEVSKRLNLPVVVASDLIKNKLYTDFRWFFGKYSWEQMNAGEYCPAELVNELVKEEIQKGISIIDGYPRNLEQAEYFKDFDINYFFINLDPPKNVLINRASGRKICTKCNRIYNIHNKNLLPLDGNKCIDCNGDVVSRKDDTLIIKRIDMFYEVQKDLYKILKKKAKRTLTINDPSDDVNKIVNHIINFVVKYEV